MKAVAGIKDATATYTMEDVEKELAVDEEKTTVAPATPVKSLGISKLIFGCRVEGHVTKKRKKMGTLVKIITSQVLTLELAAVLHEVLNLEKRI